MPPQWVGSLFLVNLATTTVGIGAMNPAFEIPKSLLKRCHKRY